ncbi:hypothetical protein BB560_001745 [Smittium megazygosporum]|uniref:PHD-type domain-containing protein n=1 Tax=Smittium megazygosporum TaxID=133381 RepID=A0A2T9ZGR8_9FUNG|nr:hypothetical protein BB560_001745 [Smittium megazygosporum]
MKSKRKATSKQKDSTNVNNSISHTDSNRPKVNSTPLLKKLKTQQSGTLNQNPTQDLYSTNAKLVNTKNATLQTTQPGIGSTGAFYTRKTLKFLENNLGFLDSQSQVFKYIPPSSIISIRGPDRKIYKARVLEYKDGKILIHYKGFTVNMILVLPLQMLNIYPKQNLSLTQRSNIKKDSSNLENISLSTSDKKTEEIDWSLIKTDRQFEKSSQSSFVKSLGIKIGDLIKVMHLDKLHYEAIVISRHESKIFVSYLDYGPEYCEWIDSESKRISLYPLNIRPETLSTSSYIPETKENKSLILSLLRDHQSYLSEKLEMIYSGDDTDGSIIRYKRSFSKSKKLSKTSSTSSKKQKNIFTPGRKQRPYPTFTSETHCSPLTLTEKKIKFHSLPQQTKLSNYVSRVFIGLEVAIRGSRADLWWPAKITKIQKYKLFVEYDGWPSDFFEWIDVNSPRLIINSAMHNEFMISKSLGLNLQKDSKKTAKIQTSTKQPLSTRLAIRQIQSIESNNKELSQQLHPHQIGTIELPKSDFSIAEYKMLFKVGDNIRAQISEKNYIKFIDDQNDISESDLWMDGHITKISNYKVTIDFGQFQSILQPKASVSSQDESSGNSLAQIVEQQNSDSLIISQNSVDSPSKILDRANSDEFVNLVESYPFNSEKLLLLNETINQPNRFTNTLTKKKPKKIKHDTYKKRNLILESTIKMIEKSLNVIDTNNLLDGITEKDTQEWSIYCNKCNMIITCYRYFCTKCEVPTDDYNYQSFELCFIHLSSNHIHPPIYFAKARVTSIKKILENTENKYIDMHKLYVPDVLDYNFEPSQEYFPNNNIDYFNQYQTTNVGFEKNYKLENPLSSSTNATNTEFSKNDNHTLTNSFYHSQLICSLCGEIEQNEVLEQQVISKAKKTPYLLLNSFNYFGPFVSRYPFILNAKKQILKQENSSNKYSDVQKRFWAHEFCLKFSPSVLKQTLHNGDNMWYNVSKEVSRGRSIKCSACRQKGATIGCFESKCPRSFHLKCSGMSLEKFEQGIIFFCPSHYKKLKNVDSLETNIGSESLEKTIVCCNCSAVLNLNDLYYECGMCNSLAKQKSSKGFSVCLDCYNFSFPAHHPHKRSSFRLKYIDDPEDYEDEDEDNGKAIESNSQDPSGAKNTTDKELQKSFKSGGDECNYCHAEVGESYRNGFGNMILCDKCFDESNELYMVNELSGKLDSIRKENALKKEKTALEGQIHSNTDISFDKSVVDSGIVNSPKHTAGNVVNVGIGSYVGNVNDYSHTPYFTRDFCLPQQLEGEFLSQKEKKNSGSKIYGLSQMSALGQLSSYKPTKAMYWSLPILTSYFGIHGRAPRWASHLGTDYHGTWLPQSVRRCLFRFTRKYDLVLSNFLGRGTDAIESFLVGRKCVGIDINQMAVNLSLRNCSFTIPKNVSEILGDANEASRRNMTIAKLKPLIFNGDSRNLRAIMGPQAQYYFNNDEKNMLLFSEDTGFFDFVFSHPPYKDCVGYSSYIDGDLSGFPDPIVFQNQMTKVILETHRLLKMNHFISCGIGDNRAERFYIPVGFQLMRNYIDHGFDIVELIVKRQRHCQAYGLGTYLCLQYDFLVFTHEFIASFRKTPFPKAKANSCCENSSFRCPFYSSLPGYRLAKLPSYDRIDGFDFKKAFSVFGFSLQISNFKSDPIFIDRKKIALETVWQIKVNQDIKDKDQSFRNLMVIKLVQRFGKNDTDWEYWNFDSSSSDDISEIRENQKMKNSTILPRENVSLDDFAKKGNENSEYGSNFENLNGHNSQKNSNSDSEGETYEQRRQRQIEENKKHLLSLGLISEFGIKNSEELFSESLSLFEKKTKDLGNGKNVYPDSDTPLDASSDDISDTDSGQDDSGIEDDRSEQDTFSAKTPMETGGTQDGTMSYLSDDQSTADTYGKYSSSQTKPNSETKTQGALNLVIIPHITAEMIFSNMNAEEQSSFISRSVCCLECKKQNMAKTIIDNFRALITQVAIDVYHRLQIGGLFVIGVQDIRDPLNKELWPMGLLVNEDIESAISSEKFKLKELIVAVPAGYENAKESSQYRVNGINRKFDMNDLKVECILDVPNKDIEHLPIVHSYYLVYTKIQ